MGADGPSSFILPINATVSDACTSVGWRFPFPRLDQQLLLHAHLTTRQLPSHYDDEDCYIWIVNDVVCNEFSSSMTWEGMRPRQDEKD